MIIHLSQIDGSLLAFLLSFLWVSEGLRFSMFEIGIEMETLEPWM